MNEQTLMIYCIYPKHDILLIVINKKLIKEVENKLVNYTTIFAKQIKITLIEQASIH
jgi:hypothetical protein